jgi:anti-sigma B factor antagonist
VNYLRTNATVAGSRVTLTLDGEVCFSTAPELRDVLISVIREFRPSRLDIDCSKLAYLDATGVGVLIGAHQRMTAVGGELTLQHVPELPRRVLDLTQAASRLHMDP